MNTTSEQRYLELLHLIRHAGEQRSDRTGTGTRSIFGPQLKFDLREGFPLLTTKKMFWKGIVGENLWFLKGGSVADTRWLKENGISIWDEWADAHGRLGPIYGCQWRRWRDPITGSIDQIAAVIKGIKENPYSRRHIVSAWNVADLPDMALEPCHVLFQFYVSTNGELSCHMYQRSADMFLGVPFNIAGYALLTHMIAQVCKLKVGTLTISFGDAHVYLNHFAQVDEQLFRKPLLPPKLWLNPEIDDIDKFGFDDIKLEGYEAYPAIKAEVAV